jgi:phosphoribosylanthranilate isomerase
MRRPYIGITGAVTRDEVRYICDQFSETDSLNLMHQPMIGILASKKTLNGEEVENRRYPSIENLPGLMEEARKNDSVLTMLHYNTSRKRDDQWSLEVIRALEGVYSDGLCDAIQLNMVWPEIDQIISIKEQMSGLGIVLQLSKSAMNERTPEEIGEMVNRYDHTIDYVLIDPSGGRGLNFNVEESVEVYLEIKRRRMDLVVGFAGGLNGENVGEVVRSVGERIGNGSFCIDVEKGVRDEQSEKYGDDVLNNRKVSEFIQGTMSILS